MASDADHDAAAVADALTLTDSRGVRHTVDVTAESLFEAAGLAVATFKKDGWTEAIEPATKLEQSVQQTSRSSGIGGHVTGAE